MPFSPAADLPNPGIKPRSPALQADSLPAEPPGCLGVKKQRVLWRSLLELGCEGHVGIIQSPHEPGLYGRPMEKWSMEAAVSKEGSVVR